MRLLDLFCGAGGAAMGYHREGFDAIHASPPCQGESIMRNLPWLRDKDYPMLIIPTRRRLESTGLPYVIENVQHARRSSKKPHGMQAGWLCGLMFDLPIFRHRLFETNWFWLAPGHPRHRSIILAGRHIGNRAREPIAARKTGHVYGFDRPGAAVGHGNMGGLSARDALGVSWMTRDEATQAIPPAYTEYIGRALMAVLEKVPA